MAVLKETIMNNAGKPACRQAGREDGKTGRFDFPTISSYRLAVLPADLFKPLVHTDSHLLFSVGRNINIKGCTFV